MSIASLRFVIDTRGSDVQITVPRIFNKFLTENSLLGVTHPSTQDELFLEIKHDEQILNRGFTKPVCRTKIWELWLDEKGDFVFVSPRQSPPKLVYIENNFHKGVIAFDFSLVKGKEIYPLASIDIRIAVNWLANFGDLVLHAAGVIVESQGLCFIGSSGAGKSTLVTHIAGQTGTTIMGEDQVILRYLSGQFWIFGTPWHEHEDRCSPEGVPLKKVFFVDRSLAPGVHPITPSEGVQRVLQTAFIPYYLPEKLPLILDRLSLLASTIPMFTINPVLGSDLSSQIFDQQI
ncbi:MAG TPA: hypothetical protein PLE10_03720 [Brevefilum sp.]|nr:hypothetical protein [Brevefilum sp.]